ncbi:hypothetical protein AGMMS49949_06290 [Alphaproteobacteria bacterium]|nr:hypothetical protein AGMMS49949_06290 [Alphaproteobacteria bacterium]
MKPLMIEATRLDSTFRPYESSLEINGTTAILPIYGFLTKRAGPFADFYGTMSYDNIASDLKTALDDPLVEKIVLDMDSPGGEVSGLFDLCDFIFEARQQKQIEAIANDDAFSAAYAIASSAERVWITRTSGVGSIGVMATHLDQSGFDRKEGLKITPIFAGQHKNDLSPHQPLSKEAMLTMQGEIDRLYALFIERVARNRNLSQAAVQATEAALFFGEEAIEAGLADGFRTLNDVMLLSKNSSQVSQKPVFATPNLRSPVMKPDVEELTEDLEKISPAGIPLENNPSDEPQDNSEENPVVLEKTEHSEPEKPKEEGDKVPTSPVLGLVKLCKIAKRPELLVRWIERDLSVSEAQESLLKEMESTTGDIVSTRSPPTKAPENPLIQAAKNRLTH